VNAHVEERERVVEPPKDLPSQPKLNCFFEQLRRIDP
jgi:hypothetical protein